MGCFKVFFVRKWGTGGRFLRIYPGKHLFRKRIREWMGKLKKMSIKIMHVVEIEEKGAYNKHMISKL